MSIFLLVISALAFMGLIGEKSDKNKLYFTIAFVASVISAVILKVL